MKGKAALSLIEQSIMLLVFAFAAAICLRAFVWADSKSALEQAQDMATVQLETAAETIKYYKGDFDVAAAELGGQAQDDGLCVSYGEDWAVGSESPCYFLKAERLDSGNELLGQAGLELTDSSGEVLSRLSVCWQEVSRSG
jgi:hypothetical protein